MIYQARYVIDYVPHKEWREGEKKKVIFWSQVKAEFFCYAIVTDDFSNMPIFPGVIAFHG